MKKGKKGRNSPTVFCYRRPLYVHRKTTVEMVLILFRVTINISDLNFRDHQFKSKSKMFAFHVVK